MICYPNLIVRISLDKWAYDKKNSIGGVYMIRIIAKNHIYFIGKVSELLESLDDLCTQYITVQDVINNHLDIQ